jgi:hypothetical protein
MLKLQIDQYDEFLTKLCNTSASSGQTFELGGKDFSVKSYRGLPLTVHSSGFPCYDDGSNTPNLVIFSDIAALFTATVALTVVRKTVINHVTIFDKVRQCDYI